MVNEEKATRLKEEKNFKVRKRVERKLEVQISKENALIKICWDLKNTEKFQILKWNFVTPTDEHISQLQAALSANAKGALIRLGENHDSELFETRNMFQKTRI